MLNQDHRGKLAAGGELFEVDVEVFANLNSSYIGQSVHKGDEPKC